MGKGTIMQSVKSLEQAYEFHKQEEKLLNEINGELAQYWKQAELANKYIAMSADAKTSSKTENKQTATAKAESKTTDKAEAKTKASTNAKSDAAAAGGKTAVVQIKGKNDVKAAQVKA